MAEIKTEIRRLKKVKEKWIAETYSKKELKTVFNLRKSEIEPIHTVSKYGLSRYTKKEISKCLDKKLPKTKTMNPQIKKEEEYPEWKIYLWYCLWIFMFLVVRGFSFTNSMSLVNKLFGITIVTLFITWTANWILLFLIEIIQKLFPKTESKMEKLLQIISKPLGIIQKYALITSLILLLIEIGLSYITTK